MVSQVSIQDTEGANSKVPKRSR